MNALPEVNFEELLTVKQACQLLKVGKSWLYDACSRNEVPHVRLGTNIRFVPDVLRKWVLTAASRGPGSPTPATLISLESKR